MSNLVLASASPRRHELLKIFGLPFEIQASNVEEYTSFVSKNPQQTPECLAGLKASSVAACRSEGFVVGADTMVLFNSKMLGKPKSNAEARLMLSQLNGQTNTVITGLAVMDVVTGRRWLSSTYSHVVMRRYENHEVEMFLDSGEALDKSGAYSVQSTTFHPALKIYGCQFNVIGLPLCSLSQILQSEGFVLDKQDIQKEFSWLSTVNTASNCNWCTFYSKE